MNIKFGLSEYWAPTPKSIRKIADSVVAATTFSGGITVLNGYPVAGTVIFVIGFVAKFVSNLFSEDTTTP
jgi:hypothetical protein